ncbi:hypothetical protein TNCV_715811 [Trichonephila clavipes]|nr:hypothetical protein TNCV_715811 [Trichonephila clavipes]
MILTSRRRHFYLVGQSKHKVGACGVNNQTSAVLAGNALPIVVFAETCQTNLSVSFCVPHSRKFLKSFHSYDVFRITENRAATIAWWSWS